MMMSGPDAVLCYGFEKKSFFMESLEAKLVIAKKGSDGLSYMSPALIWI